MSEMPVLYSITKKQLMEKAQSFIRENYGQYKNESQEANDRYCERMGLVIMFIEETFPE